MPYWDHERGVEYISTPLSWSLFTPSHFVTAPVGHGERIPRNPFGRFAPSVCYIMDLIELLFFN